MVVGVEMQKARVYEYERIHFGYKFNCALRFSECITGCFSECVRVKEKERERERRFDP